ncbi:ATP-binding protein [Niveibacterium terrae]|uniref:ATP-binding protein n=1 Tax=Niveibacterium terrae TaxID=3373598 RepID=UPI003A95D658
MKHWLGSLNLRLALILLLALMGSYSLMTWFFQTRLAEARTGQLAASVAAQVRQVESEVKLGGSVAGLGSRLHLGGLPPGQRWHGGEGGPRFRELPDAERGEPPLRSNEARPPHRDFPTRGEPIDPDSPRKEGMRRDPFAEQMHHRLSQALDLELGRAVKFHFAHGPGGPGLWVRLVGEPERWLWVAVPFPTPDRWSDGVLVIPGVGFVLAFVAALFLVVQVNRPLRRLGEALAQVGGQGEAKPLAAEGSSEIRALTGNFNAMLDRLKRLESDRTTMLAGIAHDLRTPITRLQLQIELAGGERKEAMLRELAQMSEIFEQFRLFAGGGQGERAEARDLGLLLEEMCEPWCEQGLALDLEAELTAVVKPAALRRAIENLLGNAFAYGAEPVALRLRTRGDEVLIEISDHGRGIPEAEFAEALRPFSRLDPARGGSGHSGLGLAIVDRLIADMGGRLELENCVGAGLTARLILPRAPA